MTQISDMLVNEATKEATVLKVADAMEARRNELINMPLARIWKELARVAIATMEDNNDNNSD